MDDTISRQAAIRWVKTECNPYGKPTLDFESGKKVIEHLEQMPSAQPEIKPIEYLDCANAMLKMWMDNVVTDGEYNRIMDKLNAHWRMKNERLNQQTGGD